MFTKHELSPIQRLIQRRVITESGCWELRGQKHRRYGYVGDHYAHRLAFETWKGPIPAEMLIMHSCDNPPCYNPAHLFLGTKRDNLLDAAAKGIWKPTPRKAVCKNGHPLVEGNLYRRPDRDRSDCWQCRRDVAVRARARAKERRQAGSGFDRDAASALGDAIREAM